MSKKKIVIISIVLLIVTVLTSIAAFVVYKKIEEDNKREVQTSFATDERLLYIDNLIDDIDNQLTIIYENPDLTPYVSLGSSAIMSSRYENFKEFFENQYIWSKDIDDFDEIITSELIESLDSTDDKELLKRFNQKNSEIKNITYVNELIIKELTGNSNNLEYNFKKIIDNTSEVTKPLVVFLDEYQNYNNELSNVYKNLKAKYGTKIIRTEFNGRIRISGLNTTLEVVEAEYNKIKKPAEFDGEKYFEGYYNSLKELKATLTELKQFVNKIADKYEIDLEDQKKFKFKLSNIRANTDDFTVERDEYSDVLVQIAGNININNKYISGKDDVNQKDYFLNTYAYITDINSYFVWQSKERIDIDLDGVKVSYDTNINTTSDCNYISFEYIFELPNNIYLYRQLTNRFTGFTADQCVKIQSISENESEEDIFRSVLEIFEVKDLEETIQLIKHSESRY